MFKVEYSFTNYSTNAVISGELILSGDRNGYQNKDILNHIAWELSDFGIQPNTGLIKFESVTAPY